MLLFLTAVSQTVIQSFMTGAGCAITLYCGSKTPVKRKRK